MAELAARIEVRVAALSPKLRGHVERTAEVAAALAPRHGVDAERARLAALAHDVAKARPKPELLRQAARFQLPVNMVERNNPGLLHGPVGAELLRREEGLEDRSIYEAVCWHTFAHPDLDDLGKVVFLADKLDPAKLKRYSFQPCLLELAQDSLDQAILEFATFQIGAVMAAGRMVHPQMVEARNHLIAAGVRAPARSLA